MDRKILFILSLLLSSSFTLWSDDIVMLKNGDEFTGKVSKISDKEISFSVKSGGLFKQSNVEQSIPTSDVYMVKTDKRGTIFFIDGHRIIKDNVKVDRSADLIYLVEGGEVPAWQLNLEHGVISYQKDKNKKRAMSNVGAFPIEAVFLVKYSDGSKDIFSEFGEEIIEEKTETDITPLALKVVFHQVLKGETLGSIAEKYNVEVEQIKEWNELPSNFNAGTTPKVGIQLMLQIKMDK